MIEAIIENVEVKKQAYAQVEAVVGPHCLIASNTSSLCITELAPGTKRPDKVGGLHFFNPVPLMKLVEVIRALATSQETHDALMGFAKAIGKEPIAAPDRGGFIVNRLLVPYLLDAIRCLEDGLGTVQDIDNGMKLGCGYPMGPFTLLDFVGLDTTYYIANIMFDEFRETALRAAAAAEADGAGRAPRQEVRQGLLRLPAEVDDGSTESQRIAERKLLDVSALAERRASSALRVSLKRSSSGIQSGSGGASIAA